MTVDVRTQIRIDRPRGEVAEYVSDPDNAPKWYENIKSIEWKTTKPLSVGSRVTFEAAFLGRSLVYTYEVRQLIPEESLVMSTSEGPFPMETTYAWEDASEGGTVMTLRNRGEPPSFARLAGSLVSGAMRRANRKDLERLKTILEAP